MNPIQARYALVVFDGVATLPWLRLLRPGFRHCLALLRSGNAWVLFNPLSNFTEIAILPRMTEFDLRNHFSDSRFRILGMAIPAEVPRKPAPWAPYTCVEVVKRLLGIHRRNVLTPWDLYQYINQRNNQFTSCIN